MLPPWNRPSYPAAMAGVNINSAKLAASVYALTDAAAKRAANRVALRARASVIGQNRYDTGEMMAGFRVRNVTTARSRPKYRVYNVSPHFPFQELGTPRGQEGWGFIYPKKPGGRLRFMPKGGTKFVFATKVRGVKPGNFLKHAAELTTKKDYLP